MHRSVISVREEKAPENDDEVINAVSAVNEGLDPRAGVIDRTSDGADDVAIAPLDEAALQDRTRAFFEEQRFVRSGLTVEEASLKVAAGDVLPTTAQELAAARAERVQPQTVR